MSTQLDTGAATRAAFDLSGGPVAALVAGEGGPVLLVPGYTGSKEDFAPLLDPIAAAGMRAVAIDLPGQFDSPGPDDPAAYRTDALANTVTELAATLGSHVHLLGHSYGGLVARAAVLVAPDTFSSLVLLSSGPAALGGVRRAVIEALEPLLRAGGVPAVYAALRAQEHADPAYVSPPPDLAEFLQRRFLAGNPAMLEGMGTALRTEPDRVAELSRAGVPVLVVHGADDDAWQPTLQADMAARLTAAYAVLAGAGHSAAVENPAALLDVLLPFWRRWT